MEFYNSQLDFCFNEIAKNCKIKRKKDVAINHLTITMEKLKPDDNLRILIWEIINKLKRIEPSDGPQREIKYDEDE